MSFYHCLVSTNRRRHPAMHGIEATDDAEAAFLLWCRRFPEQPPSNRPLARVEGSQWIVSDGHRTAKVQVLNKGE
jgi:hypothetical protein